ncbi:hypothetical protein [Halobellus sp. H-GB7]|uniref:hypothetical protein n=1 Tax=Halobellus sp. H-GB7 TaxID=3069756 RepID=UPI0027B73646|nr:hypothetical protein [Halobellus sp. H-GB7]MDQ2055537.1 hypothetical protein [Halobellus sp. H-GB7]
MTDSTSEPAPRRPALNRLRDEQRRALQTFREDGFASRQQLLEWLHTFQYRTLGRVADWVYFLLPTKDVTVTCCLNNAAARKRHHPRSFLDADQRAAERRRQAAKHLRPACRKALRQLRTQAAEYVDNDDPAPDPDISPYSVLRPVLDEYQQRQQIRLQRWFDGFDSVSELAEWIHDFDYDTLGEIENIPGGEEFDYELLEQRTARRVALGDSDAYAREREQLAARYLLPACNRAVRELAVNAGEATDQNSSEIYVPSG